jgi:hypothetical protein
MRSLRIVAPLAALFLGAALLAWPSATSADEGDAPAAEAPAAEAEEAPAEAVAEEAPAPEAPAEEASQVPDLREPFPFDHGEHSRAFDKAGLTCVDCHPVGAFSKPESARVVPEGPIPGPRSSCHACHQGEVEGAPRKAPSACMVCHAERGDLLPADHGLGWTDNHGAEARARNATCTDCHDTATCVTCHEGRGAVRKNPHGPGWGAFHGVEARVDPRSCSSCHVGEACAKCHVEGVLPW